MEWKKIYYKKSFGKGKTTLNREPLTMDHALTVPPEP